MPTPKATHIAKPLKPTAPAKACQRVCLSQRTDEKKNKARTHNSGFAKQRVQWLIEHYTSHQILWYVDSLVLRNPLLRKAAKRV